MSEADGPRPVDPSAQPSTAGQTGYPAPVPPQQGGYPAYEETEDDDVLLMPGPQTGWGEPAPGHSFPQQGVPQPEGQFPQNGLHQNGLPQNGTHQQYGGLPGQHQQQVPQQQPVYAEQFANGAYPGQHSQEQGAPQGEGQFPQPPAPQQQSGAFTPQQASAPHLLQAPQGLQPASGLQAVQIPQARQFDQGQQPQQPLQEQPQPVSESSQQLPAQGQMQGQMQGQLQGQDNGFTQHHRPDAGAEAGPEQMRPRATPPEGYPVDVRSAQPAPADQRPGGFPPPAVPVPQSFTYDQPVPGVPTPAPAPAPAPVPQQQAPQAPQPDPYAGQVPPQFFEAPQNPVGRPIPQSLVPQVGSLGSGPVPQTAVPRPEVPQAAQPQAPQAPQAPAPQVPQAAEPVAPPETPAPTGPLGENIPTAERTRPPLPPRRQRRVGRGPVTGQHRAVTTTGRTMVPPAASPAAPVQPSPPPVGSTPPGMSATVGPVSFAVPSEAPVTVPEPAPAPAPAAQPEVVTPEPVVVPEAPVQEEKPQEPEVQEVKAPEAPVEEQPQPAPEVVADAPSAESVEPVTAAEPEAPKAEEPEPEAALPQKQEQEQEPEEQQPPAPESSVLNESALDQLEAAQTPTAPETPEAAEAPEVAEVPEAPETPEKDTPADPDALRIPPPPGGLRTGAVEVPTPETPAPAQEADVPEKSVATDEQPPAETPEAPGAPEAAEEPKPKEAEEARTVMIRSVGPAPAEEPDADAQGHPQPAETPTGTPAAVLPVAEAPVHVGPPAPGYEETAREAVHRVMRERRDVRNGFRSDPLPDEVLIRVLEAAHTAPSVGYSQPWDFVVIRSAETRAHVQELAQQQREEYAASLPKARAKQFLGIKTEAITETPVNIVVTVDSTRGGRHTLGRATQPQMGPYSTALAVQNLWLAARAEGLGVGWVSFFDERQLARELNLPDHLEIVAYLCVGYVDAFPEEPELAQAGWAKQRPLAWVVHEEEYGRRNLPGAEPVSLLEETTKSLRPLDAKSLGEAWARHKVMTKPAGSLGVLEMISAQLAGLARVCPPPVPEPAAVAVFAADHGVHAQGVSPWPQEVTAQMVQNFLGGGAVVNAFAKQIGVEVCVVDVGVASELPNAQGLLPRKVKSGTDDMTQGPAMTREDVVKALEVGIETARDLVTAGNKALLTGDMGIANTTASAALIAVMTGTDVADVTGRGTGVDDSMHAHKISVIKRALELHKPDPADPIGVLAAVGGLEHAAIAGFIIGGAAMRIPVVLDGVIAGAAALVARAIAPESLAACIAGHCSAEPGHKVALTHLGLRPLVELELRLGEGTGAVLALPMVQAAARVMHDVATFDSAGVSGKK